jgi:hypothetical protein
MAKYSGYVGHHLKRDVDINWQAEKIVAETHLKRCPPSGKLIAFVRGLPPRRFEIFHTEYLGPYTAPILEDHCTN